MMGLKKTTKLKKMIQKRSKYIIESTAQVLDALSEVTGGADLFFKETMPQHNIIVEWTDVEITEQDHVIIKGAMVTSPGQYSAANVMVISVPLEMATNADAREVCEYMIETSGAKRKKPEPVPTNEPTHAEPPTQDQSATEFDLSKLSPEQRAALDLFNVTRGGK